MIKHFKKVAIFINTEQLYTSKSNCQAKMNTSFSIKPCSSFDSPSFIITHFPSQKYVHNQLAVCLVNCALILPGFLLNVVSVVTFCKSRKLKGKMCFFLIMLQSLVDLCVVTISIPLFTYLFYAEAVGQVSCTEIFIFSSIALITGGLSLASLCALTFERYIAVLHPITHRNSLTKNKILIYMAVSTVVLFLGVPMATISAIAYYFAMFFVIGVSIILNTFSYMRIFIAVRKRFASARRDNTHSQRTDTSLKIERRRFIQESKLARSCAIVVFIFYMCYLPGLVLSLYFIQTDKLVYRIVHSWYSTSITLNASFNSIIFFWKRPLLRKEAYRVLKIKVIFHMHNVQPQVQFVGSSQC